MPCNLTGRPFTDLVFYDRIGGVGEMYSTDGHGNLTLLKTDPTWRKSWAIVKPCNISGGRFSDLMFYDRGAGTGEFYSTDGHGNMNRLNTDTSWRKTWSIIVPANFTSAAAQDLLFYDPGAGTGEFDSTRGNDLAAAVLSTCEADYAALCDYFATSSDDLPFNIFVQSGSGGASHGHCDDSDLTIDAFDGNDQDLIRHLIVAEEAEVFMADKDNGWGCGDSNGEGLSRVLATERYPAELNTGQGNFATASAWLESDRPDWVSDTEGTDQPGAPVGCATLFLNYLHHQHGFSLQRITQTGGSTLANTYKRSHRAFGRFWAIQGVARQAIPGKIRRYSV